MKSKIQLLIILITFCTYNTYGQITTEIIDVLVNNQTTVSNCSLIDLEDNSNISLTIYFKLTKPSNQALGTTNVKALLKYSNSSSGDDKGNYTVQSNSWGNNDTEFYGQIPISVSENEIQVNSSSIFIKSITDSGVESNSCEYSLEKDEVPSFSLSPTSTTVSCGNSSPKTFTVTPSNIPSGASVEYQWNVGNGWQDTSGNNVSNFTTTTSSVTLVPFAYPPNNVRVTPVLDGDNYPQLTSTVSLGNFNPSFLEITGNDNVCDSEIYSIVNLPNNVSILGHGSSNNSIATATLDTSSGEITVNKVSDGIITLTVILQNSCSQNFTLTKEIEIGIPTSVFNASIAGNSSVCQGQSYTYTLNSANHPCAGSIVWSVSSNLNIVSQNSNSVTITKNPFSTEYAGEITASFSGSTIEIKKGVWVGVPSNDGLTIQKIGSYNLYAGQWSKLRARYIPLTYESNDLLNITFEWQIPNSMIRNYADTAYKDVKPRSSGQLNIGVRVNCECGNGEWRYRLFDVDGGNGNGGGVLIPVGGN
ncbi:hypothetical protein ESY86_20340 [Subsaximicrobium wynnwilliamsii]|uniref:Uncharacterized protein n=1 Tax=Subsaximicrobium wynnwilliamsii TaxID=291179 RepID=A0A5C6ZCJ9_9FLAO|nr:hypothetical protein [Subsaximicrobium wynnwilliamsii]TXD80648.1 hypothetical protein ESY87_20470 [Subsaximicrobium wynnwilliamsii]TXD86381.1 hypothetical protein ESY86_20340 [Subsaximicrobium wynnwilliamsii]TXD99811.1 hypothetical protein ESY88_20410 [Subsaximicrobium wynnwilliamsii]